MIYKVGTRFPRFCVPVAMHGCPAPTPLTVGDFCLIVRRKGPGTLCPHPGVWDEGCGKFSAGRQKAWERVPNRRIKYPAFEIDRNGRVCFLWDDKLLAGEPGRWEGELYHCNRLLGTLQFLVGDKYVMRRAESIGPDDCAPAQPCTTC